MHPKAARTRKPYVRYPLPRREILLNLKPLPGERLASTARLIERVVKGIEGDLLSEKEKIIKAKAKIKKIREAKLIAEDILHEAYKREGL